MKFPTNRERRKEYSDYAMERYQEYLAVKNREKAAIRREEREVYEDKVNQELDLALFYDRD